MIVVDDARAVFTTPVAASARRVLAAHRAAVAAMTALWGAADDHHRTVAAAVEQLGTLVRRGEAPGVAIEPVLTGGVRVSFGDEGVLIPADPDLGRRLGWNAADDPTVVSGARRSLEHLAQLAPPGV